MSDTFSHVNAPVAARSITGTFGVVSTSHWIGAQVGMRILELGGNAFDAAVAIGFTLQVVEPHQAGLGGEAVLLAARADDDTPVVICGQGTTPAMATIDFFQSEGLNVIPADGPLSAVVPGAFDAWLLLLRDFGTMSLADVLSPAVFYAHNGFLTYPNFIDDVRRSEKRLREWPTSRALYLPNDKVPPLGVLFRNQVLGETYQKLLSAAERAGRDRYTQITAARQEFYSGYVAEEIDRFSHESFPDDTGVPRVALLTGDDLVNWAASYEKPVHFDDDEFRLFKPGFWSQGPAALQTLALARCAGVYDMDPRGSEFAHSMVEATKLAFADREAWYGDCFSPDMDRHVLLSDTYIKMRQKMMSDRASGQFLPGKIEGHSCHLPDFEYSSRGVEKERRPNTPVLPGRDTSHIDVIDQKGNIVSATPSGGWPGGNPTIPTLGFALNTRAQMCWLQRGLASSLAPRTRPRTTLSPTLAFHKDGTRLSFGSRGSDMQDQWALQFYLRYVHFGWSLHDAVEDMPFHCEHGPQSPYPRRAYMKRLSLREDNSHLAGELEERGHNVILGPYHRWHVICAAVLSRGAMSAAASVGGAVSGR